MSPGARMAWAVLESSPEPGTVLAEFRSELLRKLRYWSTAPASLGITPDEAEALDLASSEEEL